MVKRNIARLVPSMKNALAADLLIDDADDDAAVEERTSAEIKRYVDCLTLLRDNKSYRNVMGKLARQEAERWDWKASTTALVQNTYQKM